LTSRAANNRSKQEFAGRVQHERTERILSKGEELVGLLSGASDWYNRATNDALNPGFIGMITWPTQRERIDALVLAYFPEVRIESLALERACITLNKTVIEMYKTKLVPDTFKDVHAAVLRTATELQNGVLKSMRAGAPSVGTPR
jgi:hypothetical protein